MWKRHKGKLVLGIVLGSLVLLHVMAPQWMAAVAHHIHSR